MSRLLLFDLDETVAPDEAVNAEIFRELVTTVLGLETTRVPALLAEFEDIIGGLWQAGPAADYCARLGISAWEGLWGPFGPSDHPMLSTLHAGIPGYRAAVWTRFVTVSGTHAASAPREVEEWFVRTRRDRQRAYPWSAAVLQRLAAHFLIGMITNGAPDLQRLKLAGTGLTAIFEPVVVSGDLDIGKPEPAIFAHALERAGIEPSAAAMVGDNWDRDMLGALGAGVRGFWVNPTGASQPAGTADQRVRAIRDLRNLPEALLDAWPT